MTAEEHLKQEISTIVSHYIFQLSIVRAEVDRLKLELAASKEGSNGAIPTSGSRPADASIPG